MTQGPTFDEWRQEQELTKRVAAGGTQSPISPGLGMMGHPGYTPGRRDFQFQPTPSNSKYNAPKPQPQPWIDDVDMERNWYSPMQPVWPFGPPYMDEAREWDYPTGYNINFVQQRMQMMGMLRGMRATWGVLATIIATRQDQLLRVPWTIQRRDKPRQGSKLVDEMRQFFRRPDGKRSYSQWTRLITDDLLVLDAPCIYFDKNMGGKIIAAERLDPITIFPLIDDAGRRPDAPQPAFQQIIKGLPMINLTEDEVMYVPMRPRADYPMFGYPGTEQIIVEASEAVRKTLYQLGFWAEGSIPDLIVTVPDQWSPRQIAMFQAHFDALLSGNLNLKSKVRFLPGGMKPFDVKNANGETLWSQRDETLIRLACYAYSVSPTPFVKQLNRSVAQNAQQSAEEEGLFPLMSFWKDDIIDPIIQEKFGYEDVEFVFLPRPEPDAEKQAKIHQIQLKEGIRTRNEVRGELGLEPESGGDVPMIELGNIIVPLESAAKGEAASAMGDSSSVPPGKGDEARNPSAAVKTKPTNASGASGQPIKGPAKANHTTPTPPTPVHKALNVIVEHMIEENPHMAKATREELRTAARQAQGDIDSQPHLVLHSGNYQKGHISIQGLDISIENNKGSKRGEKDQHGKKWDVTMPAPYGYIRGTIGADGDQVDCYLGKYPDSKIVWVIDQNRVNKKGKMKGFDEHKVMIGYKKFKKALKDYLKSHFNDQGHDRLCQVTELSMKEFKFWLKDGDTKKPIAGQAGHIVYDQADIKKSDTVSASTGLSSYSYLNSGSPAPKAKRKRRKSTDPRGPKWLQLVAPSSIAS